MNRLRWRFFSILYFIIIGVLLFYVKDISDYRFIGLVSNTNSHQSIFYESDAISTTYNFYIYNCDLLESVRFLKCFLSLFFLYTFYEAVNINETSIMSYLMSYLIFNDISTQTVFYLTDFPKKARNTSFDRNLVEFFFLFSKKHKSLTSGVNLKNSKNRQTHFVFDWELILISHCK